MRFGKQLWYPLSTLAGLATTALASRYFLRRSRHPLAADSGVDPEAAAWAYPTADDFSNDATDGIDQFVYATEEGQRMGERQFGHAGSTKFRHGWSYPDEEQKSYRDEPATAQDFGHRLESDRLSPPEDLEVNIETFPGYESQ